MKINSISQSNKYKINQICFFNYYKFILFNYLGLYINNIK